MFPSQRDILKMINIGKPLRNARDTPGGNEQFCLESSLWTMGRKYALEATTAQ